MNVISYVWYMHAWNDTMSKYTNYYFYAEKNVDSRATSTVAK